MKWIAIGVSLWCAAIAGAATLEDRGDVPRDAWMRLGPESKEAYVLGMVAGLDEATDVADGDLPNRKRLSAGDIARRIDEFYEADAEHRFVPWRHACVGALREVGIASDHLTLPEEVDEAIEQAAAAWLAAHPAIARRARDPDATRPPKLPTGRPRDPCMEFHGWLLENLALGATGEDSPLALQLDNEDLRVAGGVVRVAPGGDGIRGDHAVADVLVHWSDADSTECVATVVYIDGVPTRVDGIPGSTRRRYR